LVGPENLGTARVILSLSHFAAHPHIERGPPPPVQGTLHQFVGNRKEIHTGIAGIPIFGTFRVRLRIHLALWGAVVMNGHSCSRLACIAASERCKSTSAWASFRHSSSVDDPNRFSSSTMTSPMSRRGVVFVKGMTAVGVHPLALNVSGDCCSWQRDCRHARRH
jgi:hypothetical protein